jgi:hypothetical protein
LAAELTTAAAVDNKGRSAFCNGTVFVYFSDRKTISPNTKPEELLGKLEDVLVRLKNSQ